MSAADEKKLTEIETQGKAEEVASGDQYDKWIEEYENHIDNQTQAIKDRGDELASQQKEQYKHQENVINQQKDQAHKDYLKEQSGSYVDWQKQSNQYGANAEQMASAGLSNTGYSESAQVSMYNTYQNRVATARESYNRAVLNYDNMLNEAKLQNSSLLAEIAFNTLQSTLELSLQGFQYKNTLIQQKAQEKRAIHSSWMSDYQVLLNKINAEKELAERKRQFDEQKKLSYAQLEEEKRQFNILHPQKSYTGSSVSRAINNIGSPSNKNNSNDNKFAGNGNITNKGGEAKDNLTVDQKSVSALGYGPISAKKLDELVASGKVIEYVDGNKLKYKRASSGTVYANPFNAFSFITKED